MPLELQGIAATIRGEDGQLYDFRTGDDVSDAPADVRKQLQDSGAVTNPATDPDAAAPGGAPDPAEASVAQLAEFIDKGGDDGKGLNVTQTVNLAAGDPAKAVKVLEAESVAQGGDARKGVADKLQPLIDGQGS